MAALALMIVGCVFLAGHADALFTKIISNDIHKTDQIVYVPQHEDFRLQCETRSYEHKVNTGIVPSEYRHRLFVKRGGEDILLETDPADGCETVVNHIVRPTNATYATVDHLYTIFRVTAEYAGSFTYGCMLVAENARNTSLEPSRFNLSITICSEPHFSIGIVEGNSLSELGFPDEGKNAVLNTEEKCRFNGAVSYLVNDVPVSQMSSGDVPSTQAVELDDSSLEIHSPVCVGHGVCNVTAEFTYIFGGKIETSHSHMSLNDCCIDLGTRTTPLPPKVTASSFLSQLAACANITQSADVKGSTGDDPLVAERKQLEISKLELEIEVLKLKTDLLPLQILSRKKRINDITKRQLREDEEDVTALPM